MKVASIYDILEKKVSDPRTSTGKIIAEVLKEDIITGDIKNINDLAKICNCSISTITKFVQSLGYAGYRELQFLMKIEAQYISRKCSKDRLLKSGVGSFEYFTAVQKWIVKNQDWLISIVNEINIANQIYIFTSHQTHPSAKYLYEILLTLGKKPLIVNPSHQAMFVGSGQSSKETELNIFLVTGRDNDTILNLFLARLDISKSKNFLVTTVRSYDKFDHKKFKSLVIDFDLDTPMFIHRNWLFHTLFLAIFELYNESSFQ